MVRTLAPTLTLSTPTPRGLIEYSTGKGMLETFLDLT